MVHHDVYFIFCDIVLRLAVIEVVLVENHIVSCNDSRSIKLTFYEEVNTDV